MEIETVTRYKYDGKEYKSLKEIKEVIHNIIGEEVLDPINRVCPPEQHKNFIKLLDLLCKPEIREVLMKCYNVTFEEEDDEFHHNGRTTTINILDI